MQAFIGVIEKGMFRSCLLTNLKLVNNFFRKRKTVNYSFFLFLKKIYTNFKLVNKHDLSIPFSIAPTKACNVTSHNSKTSHMNP